MESRKNAAAFKEFVTERKYDLHNLEAVDAYIQTGVGQCGLSYQQAESIVKGVVEKYIGAIALKKQGEAMAADAGIER